MLDHTVFVHNPSPVLFYDRALMTNPQLESTTTVLGKLPVRVALSTLHAWADKHPGLGLRVRRRLFYWTPAREAIAAGKTLEEAADIGLRCATQAAAGRAGR